MVLEPAKSSLIVVLGPTGSGKSDLALALARTFSAEILNCDSVQVYRGLDIGSAKTPLARRQEIPHHLLDVVNPDSELTAGAYARLARETLAAITSRRRLPIIAGGTGFYLRSLLDGLSPAPARNPSLRQRLYKVASRRPATLHWLLSRRDADAAARIHCNDHQKLIRALELAASPEPLPSRLPLASYSALKLGLNPPRAELYQQLNQRAADMFSGGLLAETQALLDSGLAPAAKPLQALGYRQAVQLIVGEMTLDQALADCQMKTRHYAKRQLTWFRRESDVHWLSGFGTNQELQQAASGLVANFLRTQGQLAGAPTATH